jgi:hypothetical protein
MTERKLTAALKKIEAAYSKGFYLEALLGNYHLNFDLLKFICSRSMASNATDDKKIKLIISELSAEIDKNTQLKTVIAKKNLKIVKVWASKMDAYFKALKYHQPENSKTMYVESQKIFAILNMSAHKIFAQRK